jgi:hypothetical protein
MFRELQTKMKITKHRLTEIIKEEVTKALLKEGFLDKLAGVIDPNKSSDRAAEAMEAVEQNLEDPSFAEWLGGELGTGSDTETVFDAVQQNINTPDFVDWLYDELGLGG